MPQMDAFGLHEVLHMSNFLMDAVDEQLLQHAQIENNPEWKALAEQAHDALYNLYQAIGSASLKGDGKH